MVVLDHIFVELSLNTIVAAIFKGKDPPGGWDDKVREAIDHVSGVLTPRAVFELYPVETLGNGTLRLGYAGQRNSTILNLGSSGELLGSGQVALLCVATLGAAIDTFIRTMSGSGRILEGYLFDCIGIYALLQVSRTVYRLAEALAEQRGWGIGTVLSPGAVHGWPLKEQQKLCAMLPIDRIGVELNDCSVLTPSKSVAFAIGMGPDLSLHTVTLACQVCTNPGDCWCKC